LALLRNFQNGFSRGANDDLCIGPRPQLPQLLRTASQIRGGLALRLSSHPAHQG
jgi:hypothetical protein